MPALQRSHLLVVFSLLFACAPKTPEGPTTVHTTYRVLSGISMGAVGSAALGPGHAERFDAMAFLGGPLDAALLLRTIDRFHLGGFCPLAELERIAATNPAALNDPSVIDACSTRPATIPWEHSQDFNHWVYTTSGEFDRNSYGDIFGDLSLAYGNLLYENPESPLAPPGVDPQRLRAPPADACSNPVRVKGLRNAEYNPDGRYDAITFCDGQLPIYFCKATRVPVDFCSAPANRITPLDAAQAAAFASTACADKGGVAVASSSESAALMLEYAGRFDACRLSTRPLTVALAVDINGNGRRDYGEPILNNGQERFDDVGVDGCADPFEDGKGGCITTAGAGAQDPNGDNYEAFTRPLGTEANWQWEQGEPFRDDGLDGVPATGDTGEGNGAFDLNSGRKKLSALDFRSQLRAMPEAQRARLSFFTDGGIRDVFNFGLMAKQVHGLVRELLPGTAGEYRDFTQVPGMLDSSGGYRPWGGHWELIPPNVSILYGKEMPTQEEREAGEGDHVGTIGQASNRVSTLFNWAAARWPSLPKPSAPFGGQSYSDRLQYRTYDSKVLGAGRGYHVFLPPGYDAPENAQTRYPVVFMLHGYGQDSSGLTGATLLADAFMKDTGARLRPMIAIFPSGTCCFVHAETGARDCRERDDQGTAIASKQGWRRECGRGSFFVNRSGESASDTTRYGDSLFELMDVVDAEFRTLPSAEVETR